MPISSSERVVGRRGDEFDPSELELTDPAQPDFWLEDDDVLPETDPYASDDATAAVVNAGRVDPRVREDASFYDAKTDPDISRVDVLAATQPDGLNTLRSREEALTSLLETVRRVLRKP